MTTMIDPVVAYKVAENHRSTGDDIKLQVSHFNDAVDYIAGSCDGKMIKALKVARESWVSEINAIIVDLNVMADQVTRSTTDLSDQDETNATEVGSVGVGILSSL